jgi:hypothetical protein
MNHITKSDLTVPDLFLAFRAAKLEKIYGFPTQ